MTWENPESASANVVESVRQGVNACRDEGLSPTRVGGGAQPDSSSTARTLSAGCTLRIGKRKPKPQALLNQAKMEQIV